MAWQEIFWSELRLVKYVFPVCDAVHQFQKDQKTRVTPDATAIYARV